MKSTATKSLRLVLLLSGCFLLAAFGYQALAQTITVSGVVRNASGQPMANASVAVKESSTGTTADASGRYSLRNVPPNATLVFSSVGFASVEVPVNKRSSIDAVLQPQNADLDNVIVVGYGTQRKRDVTGAIAKVNSEELLRTASHNVIDQLKGLAAGVNVTSTGSVPGAGSRIRIRGNRSMVANTAPNNVTGSTFSSEAGSADQVDAPLIVVDGIPYAGNLNDISPNDIASLEILKDASATAIYGSRGAGGVVLVTTKRGTTGKTTFNYDAYYGVSTVMENLRVFNGAEYAQFKADAAAGHNTSPGTQPWPLTTAEQAALAAGISTDWQELIYRNAPMTNHNLSINGGSEKSRYAISFGYFAQGGIIPNQDYTRYNIRSTMDHQLNKRLKIGLTTINSLSYQNTPGGGGVTQGLMRMTPLAAPYNADGTVNLLPYAGSTDGNLISPLTLKTKEDLILSRSRRLRTFNSLYGEVQIIDGLKYRLNIGLDYFQDKGDAYSGPGTYVNTSLLQSQSTASIRNTENYQYTIENLLLYEKTINQKHRIGFTGLYSVQKNHGEASFVSAIGVPFDYIQNKNIYLANTISAGTANDNYFADRGLVSYMGRVTYSYSGLYSLTATVRTDGSSVLSKGNQYFTYPAFAAAWNLGDEKFMSKASFISQLKLRVGWGIAGGQGINAYQTLGQLSSTAYNFGQSVGGQQGGYILTLLPNETLKWQSTSQYNVGLDFGILKNRITGSIEVYGQKTKDILLPLSLPPSNGAERTFVNRGKTKGSGLEISLSSINVKNAKGLTWTTDVNYFFNREEIVELSNPNQLSDIGNGWFVGQPITVIYDYNKLGIWQTGDRGLTTQISPVQKPGDIQVQDINGDNRITPADRIIVGNFQPKFEAGMSNTLTFKNFDLAVSVYARYGMKIVVPYLSSESGGANFTGYNWFMTGRNNQLKIDYWTPTNPTNKFPQPDALATPQYTSTLSYVDGSFVKCRSINLGYTIPSSALSKLGVDNLRAYVSIVNPFVIWAPFVKEEYGPDPEGNGFGGGIRTEGTGDAGTVGRQITVNANNPATRQFIFGVNLRF